MVKRTLDIVQMDGFDFEFNPGACDTCPGACCCGESGQVWVSQQEMNRICEFLQMNCIDFMEKYLRRVGNRFSCKERIAGHGLECIFFQGIERKCAIYSVRPSGCRTYPFWEHFKMFPEQVAKECPGIVVYMKRHSHLTNES
ncbi:MAG: YkgJ family cysteine cluster protein [Desulfocapsaceae bacterium]|nr:YkgJ family cysteine cluster protein [Desulfocapsaceae bacterium]